MVKKLDPPCCCRCLLLPKLERLFLSWQPSTTVAAGKPSTMTMTTTTTTGPPGPATTVSPFRRPAGCRRGSRCVTGRVCLVCSVPWVTRRTCRAVYCMPAASASTTSSTSSTMSCARRSLCMAPRCAMRPAEPGVAPASRPATRCYWLRTWSRPSAGRAGPSPSR